MTVAYLADPVEPTPPPAGAAASSSNQLLDLLAGATKRLTTPSTASLPLANASDLSSKARAHAQPQPWAHARTQAPGELSAIDKTLYASSYASLLRAAGPSAFDDATTSGLSILSPSASNAPRHVTLDLSAKQAAGPSTLYPAKIETSGVALLPTSLAFQCNVSQGGLLPAAKIASLGTSVACYVMSKGKVRLIHVETGERTLLRTPQRAAIRSLATFQPSSGNYLMAALTDKCKETGVDEIIVWSIDPSFVRHGSAINEPEVLVRIAADQAAASDSLHRFTGVAWHPTEPKLAVSTSDNAILVLETDRLSGQMRESQFDASTRRQAAAATGAAPLAGWALSNDGSLIASIVVEGQQTWRIKIVGTQGNDGENTIEVVAASPLEGSELVVSHLSMIGDDASQVRTLLIGFERNTVLALFDIALQSWKLVYSFRPPVAMPCDLAEAHYNLPVYDATTSLLLIANSVRSSIFAIRFDFEPLPAAVNGVGGESPLASLADRLRRDSQPWSVRPSTQIRECAVSEPCTALSIVRRDAYAQATWAQHEVRFFAGDAEGVDLVHLPLAAIGAKAAAERPAAHSEPITIYESSSDLVNGFTTDAHEVDASPITVDQSASLSDPAASASRAATNTHTEARVEVEQLAIALAGEMNDTIYHAISTAVNDATNSTPANGIHSSVAGTLPLELEKLIRRPEIHEHLSRGITQSILPAVQRTAVEMVSKVLAPHFEEVMMDVGQRVESAIVSEMTTLRKSMVDEQSDVLKDNIETSRAIAAGMGELFKKLNEVSKRNAELEHMVRALSSSEAKSLPHANGISAASASASASVAAPDPVSASAPIPAAAPAPGPRPTSKESKPNSPAARDAVSATVSRPATPSNRRSKKDASAVSEAATAAAAAKKSKAAAVAGAVAPVSVTKKGSTPDVGLKAVKAILPDRIAVVGAGPVGCLAALGFAQRGCKVDIYEARQDPRTAEATAKSLQRSINLAISTRGLTGLRSVAAVGMGRDAASGLDKDLADIVLDEAVPMRARMIHTVARRGRDGRATVTQNSQAYGANGECINSVDRSRLNNLLLQHASQHLLIDVHFDSRLLTIDFEHDLRGATRWADAEGDVDEQRQQQQQMAASANGTPKKNGGGRNGQQQQQSQNQQSSAAAAATDRVRLEFDVNVNSRNKHTVTRYAGLVLGCDGAYSGVRSAMGSMVRMGYSHEYVDNGYVELSIPPCTSLGAGSRSRGDGGLNGSQGGHDAWSLDPNHLHIWPRRDFMLIALPNRDGSFTCTLFAPFHIFKDHLSAKRTILAFFDEHFPDAVDLIGDERLVEDLLARRPSPLGSVKCKPYHFRDRAILLGDSAHSMLPFYGQGLNCGFEDVRVLLEKIDGAAIEGGPNRSVDGKGEAKTMSSNHSNNVASAAAAMTPLHRALESYTTTRHPDLLSITQLASDNYREMASSVLSSGYLLRKRLDGLLMKMLPRWMWQSLYMMVTFSNIGYAEVIRREKRQQRIVRDGVVVGVVGCVGLVGLGVWRSKEVWRPVLSGLSETVERSLIRN